MKKVLSVLLAALVAFSALCLAASAEEPLNYVVLGDSIARGAGVWNADEASFGRIIADTNGYNYVNYGIDGFRTIDLIDLLDREDVSASVAAADIISLSIGGNDYLQQNLPKIFAQVTVGNYKIVNDIEKDFNENFAVIIGKIKALNPGATLIVQTLYNPRFDLLRGFYDEAVVRINRGVNAYLEANPGAYEILDVHAEFTPDHFEYISADTIHPSAIGNIRIAEMLLQKLCDLGLGTETEPVINKMGIDSVPFLSYILNAIKKVFDAVISVFA